MQALRVTRQIRVLRNEVIGSEASDFIKVSFYRQLPPASFTQQVLVAKSCIQEVANHFIPAW